MFVRMINVIGVESNKNNNMNKKWCLLLGLLFYLLPLHVNAKTVYYVKSGATGDGSSWSNASGSIQDMINSASPGDEVWVAYGAYKAELDQHWGIAGGRLFGLKLGVSILGGFCGEEDSKQERMMFDRDQNDKIEPWEYKYETVLLSGISCYGYDWEHEIEKEEWHESFVSGLTITGEIDAGIDIDLRFLNGCVFVTDCDIHHNGAGLYDAHDHGIGLIATVVEFCNIHHNSACGIIGGNAMHSWIHHNGTRLSDIGGGVSGGICHNCEIYKNEGNFGGGSGSEFYDCNIYENYSLGSGGGLNESTAYNCNIYNNISQRTGGGAYGSFLFNCVIRDNFSVFDGGGTSGGLLKDCKVYNNEASGNRGGMDGGTAISCSIFNNRAGEEGGGCGDGGYYYNCNIYNNYAPTYGGISSSSYVNCTIVNNKSLSGNENGGSLTNCIVVGTFDGSASYSAFTDSYVKGDGNFLATEKELKFVKSTSFTGNASNEKQLEELKNADFRLTKGSSAIDMGQQKFGISLPPEDYSGYPRPMGVKTDIGAHEYPSYRALPYENKFDESSLSMNVPKAWRVEKLSSKDKYYLYYTGDHYNYQKQFNYITTPFFDKTASNKINLSFDISAKFKTMDQKEKMHIILAYLESDKRDKIMSYSNTDYIQDIRFSKEISSWVKNKVFRVLFAVEDSQRESYYGSNILYSGVSNLKISKQDATVDIIAKDKVCMYDGKPQSVDFQINDTRVDKNKAVVTYQKEGSTQSSTTPPTNAGVYKVLISIEDGSYFGMKEVKLTIEKANQKILWEQKLTTMGTLEKIRLEATASSGLPVQYSVDDELLAKIEKIDNDWWLVSDTLIGNVTVKASQPGNENYNLANSVLKTIKVYSNLTDIAEIETNNLKAYYLKESNSIRIEGAPIGCKVYVYDTLGHLYTSKEIIYGEDQIQMRNTSGGIYYLLFVDKDKKRTIKILTD